MPSVRVRDDHRPSRQPADELVLPNLPDRVTARDLIRTRVREEVARANADSSRPRRLLVAPHDAEVTLNGYKVKSGRAIDWRAQADVAEEAFVHQGFFLFVDGRQVGSLDEEVELGADSEIRFLRLTPLVGG